MDSGKIHLLLPGLFWLTGIQKLEQEGLKLNKLSKVLSRAKLKSSHCNSLYEQVFRLFGVEREPGKDLPIAAVSLIGQNQKVDGNTCWGCATPVHFLVDRDRLILLKPDPGSKHPQIKEELDYFASSFNEHFVSEAIELHVTTHHEWYVQLRDCPNLETFDILQVTGRHIEEFLPHGVEGKKFRSMLNEIQMLFFKNNSDKNRNETIYDINGIWLSGFGKTPAVSTDYTKIYADNDVVKGLAKLSGIDCKKTPFELTDMVTDKGNLLVLMTDLLNCELVGDVDCWMRQISVLEDKLTTLLKSSELDKEREIVIDPCDDKLFMVTPRTYALSFYKPNKRFRAFLSGH
ncbi:MAG: hypothetical protein AB2598_06060 [Candidatus Thiodiazotropha sp.]